MIGQALKVFNDLMGWLMKWTQNVVAMVTYIIGEGISRVGDALIANAVLISTLFQRP